MNWQTILTSLIGAGLLGFLGSLTAAIVRRPMTRAEVAEKVEEVSFKLLDRMEQELTRRTAELHAVEGELASLRARDRDREGELASLRGRDREREAEVDTLRTRVRELELELATLRRGGPPAPSAAL